MKNLKLLSLSIFVLFLSTNFCSASSISNFDTPQSSLVNHSDKKTYFCHHHNNHCYNGYDYHCY